MRLYIVRHAEAEDRRAGLREADRALTARGRAQAAALARLFDRGREPADFTPERVLSSVAARAQQTAAAIAGALGLEVEAEARLGLHADDKDALALVKELAADDRPAVVVGHDPTLSDLVERLGGGGHVKKGQLVAFDVSVKRAGFTARELGRFRSDD